MSETPLPPDDLLDDEPVQEITEPLPYEGNRVHDQDGDGIPDDHDEDTR